jgi:hypothetical protein
VANVVILTDSPDGTGGIWYRRAVITVSKARANELINQKVAALTVDDPLAMVKVMALKRCTEPSTGDTIFATQVLAVTEADAQGLIAQGDAVASDEAITRDLGALAKKAGVGKDYPDDGVAMEGVVR